MHIWSVKSAKARFSEFLNTCLSEGSQMVTRSGAETAVLVPVQEWQRLQSTTRPSLKQLLLADQARTDTLTPTSDLGSGTEKTHRLRYISRPAPDALEGLWQ
ncbi:type II toxin-antitoxin system Phd/YefM family antitoxin [Sulfuriferula nivalis]|uniref:Antitoxin n=1 Tax=Sulfuriferula nivalis TaxID=2675298 RepID=A0A809RT96_9PROT|nr:type II toxin-antitoxin system Phd/YefM family antitoxin [Sulfuriferula nivalis]BBP02111.1 hypothetical protein SFSGTM_28190 [Sulfuriferula nivalis]